MDKHNFTIKDVTDDMISATPVNVYWWAFIHWEETLTRHEENLSKVEAENASENTKAFLRYCVVEAKKVIVELYEKLMTFKELQDNDLLQKPDWLDEFLNGDTKEFQTSMSSSSLDEVLEEANAKSEALANEGLYIDDLDAYIDSFDSDISSNKVPKPNGSDNSDDNRVRNDGRNHPGEDGIEL